MSPALFGITAADKNRTETMPFLTITLNTCNARTAMYWVLDHAHRTPTTQSTQSAVCPSTTARASLTAGIRCRGMKWATYCARKKTMPARTHAPQISTTLWTGYADQGPTPSLVTDSAMEIILCRKPIPNISCAKETFWSSMGPVVQIILTLNSENVPQP